MSDPGMRALLDALAFATASLHGDTGTAMGVAQDGLRRNPGGFLDAVATTVQMLAEELDEAGGDAAALLRDLGLGVQTAALDETTTSDDRHD
ncbi:hypothetical protein [Egicoccus sp. AB-alg2]|uniref:hypothetical protein n=1 Tax=Egicoccus sp. AB-alg2 TaxID=3242693 RepID=UPI00359E984A